MGGKDFRTTSQQTGMSFYVFDDLRFSQNHSDGGNVFRYDTVEEAIKSYQKIQFERPRWTTALGCNVGGAREIDLVQSRGGYSCLITDYQKLAGFKDNPDVLRAIETVLFELKVDWQVDHELIGCSILVPHEFGDVSYDRYLDTLKLNPVDPENVLTSIQEVSVQGEAGWLSLRELRELVASSDDGCDVAPKVTGFNVAYESRDPGSNRTGYIGVSPADLRILKQEYHETMRRRELELESGIPGIKTIDGWHATAAHGGAYRFHDYATVGDAVSRDVVDYFMRLAPGSSATSDFIQVRSPYDFIDENEVLRPVFTTFVKMDGLWRYGGECFCGEKPEFARSAYEGSWREMIAEAKEMAKAINSQERSEGHRPRTTDLDH